MRIGVDIDGVLANFNDAYAERLASVTERDLRLEPERFPTWNWPERAGYTREEINATWENIKNDQFFWRDLHPFPDTAYALGRLHNASHSHDIYFVTARPGFLAKQQTEEWLERHGYRRPTVLMTSDKASAADLLRMHVYIDDRLRNAQLVAIESCAHSFLLDRSWNQLKNGDFDRSTRVNSVDQFLSIVGL